MSRVATAWASVTFREVPRSPAEPSARSRGAKTALGTFGAAPVASIDVPDAPSPAHDPHDADPSEGANRGETTGVPAALERQRAAEALQAAFNRLAPQGSDVWNFLAAFTHLGDRYGPYQPGASALSDARGPDAARRSGRAGRIGKTPTRAARTGGEPGRRG